jgi:hypothetical protein
MVGNLEPLTFTLTGLISVSRRECKRRHGQTQARFNTVFYITESKFIFLQALAAQSLFANTWNGLFKTCHKRCHLRAEITVTDALAAWPPPAGARPGAYAGLPWAPEVSLVKAVPRNNGGRGRGAHAGPDPLGWVSTLGDHGRDVHATRSRGAGAEVFIPPEPIDEGFDFRPTRPGNFRAGNNPC